MILRVVGFLIQNGEIWGAIKRRSPLKLQPEQGVYIDTGLKSHGGILCA